MTTTIPFFLVLLLAASAFAGPEGPGTSGGGGAYVCRSKDGTPLESELVDLWEARNLDGEIIPISEVDHWQQAAHANEKLRELNPGLARSVSLQLEVIKKQFRYLPWDVHLGRPHDVDESYQKPGCPLAGMMYYDGTRDMLAIDRTVFNALPNETEVGAAMFHEALYKALREDIMVQAQNSVATRKLVGCLFGSDANKCLKAVPRNKLPRPTSNDVFRCTRRNGDDHFLVSVSKKYPDGKNYKWFVASVLEKLNGAEFHTAVTHEIEVKENASGEVDNSFGRLNEWNFSGLTELGVNTFGPDIMRFEPFKNASTFGHDEFLRKLATGMTVAVTLKFEGIPREVPITCEATEWPGGLK